MILLNPSNPSSNNPSKMLISISEGSGDEPTLVIMKTWGERYPVMTKRKHLHFFSIWIVVANRYLKDVEKVSMHNINSTYPNGMYSALICIHCIHAIIQICLYQFVYPHYGMLRKWIWFHCMIDFAFRCILTKVPRFSFYSVYQCIGHRSISHNDQLLTQCIWGGMTLYQKI